MERSDKDVRTLASAQSHNGLMKTVEAAVRDYVCRCVQTGSPRLLPGPTDMPEVEAGSAILERPGKLLRTRIPLHS